MSQIIFGILGLLLFSALAGAGIYYGGSIFQDGDARAGALANKQNLELVRGALDMYKVQNGTMAPNLAALAPDYIKQTLVNMQVGGTTLSVQSASSTEWLALPVESSAACAEINTQAGLSGAPTNPPACTWAESNWGSERYYCCDDGT